MKHYYCAHCGADLGAYIPDTPEPICVDHPEGAVNLVEIPDGDQESQ